MLEKIHHKSAPKEVVNALVTLYHQGEFLQILVKEKISIEYGETLEKISKSFM